MLDHVLARRAQHFVEHTVTLLDNPDPADDRNILAQMAHRSAQRLLSAIEVAPPLNEVHDENTRDNMLFSVISPLSLLDSACELLVDLDIDGPAQRVSDMQQFQALLVQFEGDVRRLFGQQLNESP